MNWHKKDCNDHFYHSDVEKKWQFWMGEFGRVRDVKYVKIYNRGNTLHQARLADFEIVTDSGEVCASYSEDAASVAKRFACDAKTKSLKIVNNKDSPLELCEVEVFGTPQASEIKGEQLPFTACDASSVSGHHRCEFAMDTHKRNCHFSFFHTGNHGVGQFWRGDFARKMHLEAVRIYNRYPEHKTKLGNFRILTDTGVECAKFNSGFYFEEKTFPCKAFTRSITIVTEIDDYLELCEVEAFGDPGEETDFPLQVFRNCDASSVHTRFQCSYAMDRSDAECQNHFYHSAHERIGEWWCGDFGEAIDVQTVKITTRSGTEHHQRMTDIKVITDSGNVCAVYSQPRIFFHVTLDCKARTKSIKIEQNKSKFLELCEVEVYGLKASRVIDGQWSEWGKWGSCSASCGGGKQTRTRTCSRPSSANGGKNCDGEVTDTQACGSAKCEEEIMPNYKFERCTASSEHPSGIMGCQKAMDTLHIRVGSSCTKHDTFYHSAYPWKGEYWTGFFNDKKHVTKVLVINRGEFQDRLRNFKILTDNGQVCASYNDKEVFDFKLFDCNAVTKSITVKTESNEYLALCEVAASGPDV